MIMQLSYLVDSSPAVAEHIGNIPSTLKLQQMIEEAWDQGINPDGRLQTGGITGTRKHIGTQEVGKPLGFFIYNAD